LKMKYPHTHTAAMVYAMANMSMIVMRFSMCVYARYRAKRSAKYSR
jgi:hypothetical protein